MEEVAEAFAFGVLVLGGLWKAVERGDRHGLWIHRRVGWGAKGSGSDGSVDEVVVVVANRGASGCVHDEDDPKRHDRLVQGE